MDNQSVNVVRIVQLAQKYQVESHIMRWAGLLRFFAYAFPGGFMLKDWHALGLETLDGDIVRGFLHILVDANYVCKEQQRFKVVDDDGLQRMLELVNIVLRINEPLNEAHESRMLWSIPSNANVPSSVVSSFQYINSWIIQIAQRAIQRILFVSPYYTESGMRVLEPTILALLRNRPNVSIQFVVSDLAQEANSKAFRYLFGVIDHFHHNRISVYQPSNVINESLWFHAKFMVVDGKSGYLGSANFSKRALDDQFELGVPLNGHQAETLGKLVDYWMECGNLVQYSFP
ncbi:hypothetical protein SD51_13325 [Alicyclobacillus tengchongensis]|nr:hypothetical protein SD51_13325 [Alicyclobacillus tengchongensis]